MHMLDLAPAFARDWKEHHVPLTFEIDYHWNEHGHRIVADALYDYIQQNGLLRPIHSDSLTARLTTVADEDSH